MLNQDIRKAQKIVSGAYSPLKDKEFHQDSFIYKTSNEDIRKYQNFLSERENIFSITASGDQILNSILLGAKKVTACDISRFPNYFLALKESFRATVRLMIILSLVESGSIAK